MAPSSAPTKGARPKGNVDFPDSENPPIASFVFTEFSGEPQCFLTDEQIIAELAAAGFTPDPSYPLRE